MKALFVTIGFFDAIVLAASYSSNRYWGFRVCHETFGACDYPLVLAMLLILCTGMYFLKLEN
jgi:hypothetical protein